ncbi:hypothetical protein Ciccas_007604 [Cichlidogyrus casuarinus]|uniref:Uncharacterized protein n=1 Tax=Cichlidogyrus casuarinus TaxID=1844966 RepID=A0ABD2Q2S2_9PLAT
MDTDDCEMSSSVRHCSSMLQKADELGASVEKEFKSPAKINLMKIIDHAGNFDEPPNSEIGNQDSDNDSHPNQLGNFIDTDLTEYNLASDEGYTGSDENDNRKCKREENMLSHVSYGNPEKEEIISRLTDEEVLSYIKLLESRDKKDSHKMAKIVHLASTVDVLVQIDSKHQSFLDKRLNKAKRIDSHSRNLMKHRLKNRRK